MQSTGNVLELKFDKLSVSKGEKLTLEFEIEPILSADKLPQKRLNLTTIAITDEDDNIYTSSVTDVDSNTNKVEAAVRWLYLNIEKEIPSEDNSQAFLFKVASGLGNVYTDIYTKKFTDGDKTTYKGNQLIQITKRGNYTITEEDWANTDYDVDKAVFGFEDIDYTDESLKQSSAVNTEGQSVSVYIPRAMYKSTAIPLWATGDNDGLVYPTVTCVNSLSEYAWLSAQDSAENSFEINLNSIADKIVVMAFTVETESDESESEPTVPNDVATSQGVFVTDGLRIKKEDEENN